MRLGVKLVPQKGGILVGFRERNSRLLTSLHSCKTLDQRISDLLPGLHQMFAGIRNNHRIPQVEVASGDNNIGIVGRHLEPLDPDDISRLTSYAREFDLHLYYQSGGTETVTPLWPASAVLLQYELPEFDLPLEFAPLNFIQVNAAVNKLVVGQAVRYLQPNERTIFWICVLGAGEFSLPHRSIRHPHSRSRRRCDFSRLLKIALIFGAFADLS